MKTENIFQFKKARYLWLSLILSILSLGLYLSQGQIANGGTWQGYTLGVAGVLIIVWLSVLGIRKRRYSSRLGTVMGWTSAHIYLGLSLIWIATLHTGFEFSWNVHFLAYLFMVIVIISGVVGAAFYVIFPRQAFSNRGSLSTAALQKQAINLQESILTALPMCTQDTQLVIASALENTEPMYTNLKALKLSDNSFFLKPVNGQLVKVNNADQDGIRQWLAEQLTSGAKDDQFDLMTGLLDSFSDYGALLKKIRTEYRLKALMKSWLTVHIPFTLALLVSLVVHILTTFLYW